MVGRDHSHPRSISSRYIEAGVEVELDDPFRINPKLLLHETAGDAATVNGAVPPVRGESDVMVTMEMAEEIGVAVLHRAVPKGIHANEKSGHDFVERASPLICWLPA